ncbi:MAG: kinase [Brevundimonas subvibrioides]|uniref:Kinase n=1 Tax=Brevundimonas subvibrioides TaxID=74313 RepID=A0A258HPQ2_9CAUL|nr:MAG: kinase [Brevundimonas subvibrioides]
MVDPRLIQAVDDLIRRHARPGHIPLIAIAGAQGSGKSTLAAEAATRLSCAALSLDDVYLTRAGRADLAARLHPLFAVRGPPGTHDLDLLDQTLARLRAAGPGDRTAIPAFDKLADDRRAEADWPVFAGRPRAVLLEGWCLGATPQGPAELSESINDLERIDDPDAVWRRAINHSLATRYARLFATFDALLFLKAPTFDRILDWRVEQEAGLLGIRPAAVPGARRTELARFIQAFERITRHMLAGGVTADSVIELDEDRAVLHIRDHGGA